MSIVMDLKCGQIPTLSTGIFPNDRETVMREYSRVMNPGPTSPATRCLFLARVKERQAALKLSDRAISMAVTGKPDLMRDLRRRKTLPRTDIMHLLADTLKCTPDYLLGITDQPEAPPLPLSDHDREVLEQFITAALEYRGALSIEELAESAADAFLQHYIDGMTPKEFRRVLQFRKRQGGGAKSR